MRKRIAVLATLLALLAAACANAHFATPSRILGGWYTGDTSTEASAIIVFLGNGDYVHIAGAHRLDAPSRRDGYERGTYTFDDSTGAFSVMTTSDTNGDLGLSGLSGVQGAKAELAGDTLMFVIPGQGVLTFNRVSNPTPIVGAWVDGGTSIDTVAIVFLPDSTYYYYKEIAYDVMDPPPEVRHGRYYLGPPDLAFVGDPIVWVVEATSSTAGHWTLGNDISVPVSRVGGGYLPPSDHVFAAVEFHHAGAQHYFVSGSAEERRKLDSGEFRGWARTGQSFKVFPRHDPGTVPVCRFLSKSAKVSHFHTAFAHECAAVITNPYWTFEGEVFDIRLPDAAGNCALGTIPLYRLYNNGRTGAPNHVLTTSQARRSGLLAQGYMAEGLGSAGVAGCVLE
jgi:Repeat of unknown function (DUF5648)